PTTKAVSPAVTIRAPGTSSCTGRRPGPEGRTGTQTTLIAALMAGRMKGQRQWPQDRTTPETRSPELAPMLARTPHKARARVRRAGSGNTELSSAIAAGAARAAPTPCAKRADARTHSVSAAAAANEAAPKTTAPVTK